MGDNLLDNKYVSTAITIVIGLYASMLGPNLPQFVKDLFKNMLFKIFVLFLIMYRANKDPSMSIVIAVAFILTLDYIYKSDAQETFKTINKLTKN